METFHWDKNFETGLNAVDEQHHSLVHLINRFSSAIGQGADVDPAELERVYGELAQYAAYHFEEEGLLMVKEGVDLRHQEPHALEHKAFLEDVARIRLETGQRFLEGARPLHKFLTHWLVYHILGMDQAMAAQIRAIREGVDPAEAFGTVVAEGDAARSPLLESLNGLFELVSERNRQLSEMNQSLELKVAERTRELSEANRELAEANAALETLATTDVLTGLFNRRYAMDRLASEIASSKRHGEPLSLVLMDADGFKAVNDTYGHDAGDTVIRALGCSLKQGFRVSDVVCRMGGDEFLAICPRTPAAMAAQVAERVRSAIASTFVPAGDGEWKGSLSAGVSCLGPGVEDAEGLIKAADRAVYEAKHQGRNRVVVCGDMA